MQGLEICTAREICTSWPSKNFYSRKPAYAIHKYADVPLQFVLGEESSKVVKFRTLYEKAISIASKMMDCGETSLDVAVIGRFRSQSAAAALAQVNFLFHVWNEVDFQVMLGNRTLCLDSAEKANFAHIQTIGCSVVVIDSSSLTEDLDLSSFSGRGILKFQLLAKSLRTLERYKESLHTSPNRLRKPGTLPTNAFQNHTSVFDSQK